MYRPGVYPKPQRSKRGFYTAFVRHRRFSVGVGVGYLEDDITRLNEQKARQLWLDERLPRDSRSISTWQGLRDEPGSDGLFKLLSELGGTADSMNAREDMTHRVRRVLQAAVDDTRLRAAISARACSRCCAPARAPRSDWGDTPRPRCAAVAAVRRAARRRAARRIAVR